MNNFFLETHQVVKRFANHTALNGVSIQVPEGQIFGLLGPNGAGKTTLIRIINRITAPDSGEVRFNGHLSQAEDIYHIGYLPEERGLYKKMKVGEQAIYLAQLKGLSKAEATSRLKLWFEKFEITPWWNKKLEELSKGMQQKVQFIITILHKPQLLIFDEPFSGFDPVNAELLKREILELKKEGHTIIFSTHNMASVEEICDNIALINHSEVVFAAASSTSIKLWTYPIGGWGNDETVQGLISSFNAKYPDIKVTVEYLDYTNGDDQVNTAIEGGSAPDLIMEGPERLVANWGAKGVMAPLNDLWTDDAKKDIYESVESACKDTAGNYYEYPLCMTAHCMAVNMTKVKEVGADQYIDTDKHTWSTDGFLKTVDALYNGGYENVAAIYCAGQGGDQGTRAIINIHAPVQSEMRSDVFR